MAEGEGGGKSLKDRIIGFPPIQKAVIMLVGEFIGTFMLVFLGCISTTLLDLLPIAVAWGCVVGSLVTIIGPISGCHINPAVTTACIVYGDLSVAFGLLYIITQILGSILGFFVLNCLLPKSTLEGEVARIGSRLGKVIGICNTHLTKISPIQGIFLEFFATMLLIGIVCSAHDPRNAAFKDSFPLKVGALIIADVICIGPFTGASLNTARTLGPAIINNFWTDHYVYWLGPLGAGLITPLFYIFVLNPKEGEAAG